MIYLRFFNSDGQDMGCYNVSYLRKAFPYSNKALFLYLHFHYNEKIRLEEASLYTYLTAKTTMELTNETTKN